MISLVGGDYNLTPLKKDLWHGQKFVRFAHPACSGRILEYSNNGIMGLNKGLRPMAKGAR